MVVGMIDDDDEWWDDWWWWWWSIGSQAATLDGPQLRAKTNGKGGKSGKGKVRLPDHPTETLKWVNDEKNQDSNVVIRIRNRTWFFSICFLFVNVSVFKTTPGGQWPDVYEWQRCRSHAGGIRAGDVAWSFTVFHLLCWYIPGFTLQTHVCCFSFKFCFAG